MGEKSLQKKKYIIETAKKVFVKKGFKSVTMKDIVEACEISRGGLYLYFNSTEELFNAVLEAARSDKRIGKPLEAAVVLKAGDDASREVVETVKSMNLSELFIVSNCLISDEDVPDSVVGTGSANPGLQISVTEAPGTKCPRCWVHSAQADPETGLCPRCSRVVAELG